MLLAVHNAHLTQIASQGTQGDPVLGTATTPGTVKFTGICQAAMKDVTSESVEGNTRLLIRQVLIDLPSNLPQIAENDQLTLTNIETGETVTLEVRIVDETTWGLGRYRVTCRYV